MWYKGEMCSQFTLVHMTHRTPINTVTSQTTAINGQTYYEVINSYSDDFGAVDSIKIDLFLF